MSRNKQEMMSFGNPSNVGAGKVSIDDSDSEVENEEVENEGNKAEKQPTIGTWGKQATATTPTKKKLQPISFSDIEKQETVSTSQKQPTTEHSQRVQRQPQPSGTFDQGQRASYDFQSDDGFSQQPKNNFFGNRNPDSTYQRRNFNDSYQNDDQDNNNNYPKSHSRDYVEGGGQGGYYRGGGQKRNQYYDNSDSNGRNYNDGGRGTSSYEQTKITFRGQQQVAPGTRHQPHVDEFRPDDDDSNNNRGFGAFRGQGRRDQEERKPQIHLGSKRGQQQAAGGRNEGNFTRSISNDQTTGPARRNQPGGFSIGFHSKQQVQPTLETTEWKPSE